MGRRVVQPEKSLWAPFGIFYSTPGVVSETEFASALFEGIFLIKQNFWLWYHGESLLVAGKSMVASFQMMSTTDLANDSESTGVLTMGLLDRCSQIMIPAKDGRKQFREHNGMRQNSLCKTCILLGRTTYAWCKSVNDM